MARYHSNLKYHDDSTEKHNISESDIRFLIELQKEMNTQDNVGQADPRYWVIRGYEKKFGIENGYEDGSILVDNHDPDITAYDMEEVFDLFAEGVVSKINDRDGVMRTMTLEDKNLDRYETIRVSWEKDAKKEHVTLSGMHDVIEWLLNNDCYNYRIVNYKNSPIVYGSTMFLTQKAAEDHLRANYYHYSEDAHTYAMTSWRDKETETLWKVLRGVNWEQLLSQTRKDTETTID